MKDIIDIEDAKADIEKLNTKIRELSNEWENCDGNPSECDTIALAELLLVKGVANKYKGFSFEYKESEYTDTKYDEWYENETFTEEDFEHNNVNSDNYGKADAVAFDMKIELVEYITSEIINQTPKIELIGTLCEIERYQTIQEFCEEEDPSSECDLDDFILDDIVEMKERIIERLIKE